MRQPSLLESGGLSGKHMLSPLMKNYDYDYDGDRVDDDDDEDDEDDKLGAVWQAHVLTTDENYDYDYDGDHNDEGIDEVT